MGSLDHGGRARSTDRARRYDSAGNRRWRLLAQRTIAAFAALLAIGVPAVAELSNESGDAPAGFERSATLDLIGPMLTLPDELAEAGSTTLVSSSASPTEARSLLDETFSSQLDEPTSPLDLGGGVEVSRFLGKYTARLRAPDGDTSLALSALPLRTRDDDGRLLPVDLTLERSGSEFVADNPLVSAVLPAELAAGIEVGETGLEVAPGGTTATTARGLVENKVFYPEVRPDADWAVGPVPTGVEVFVQLRSEAAPESHPMHIGVPDGARVAAADGGGAEIVRDGEVLGRVQPPTALDAEGRAVPVEYEVGSTGIVVRVPHRGAGFAYPILVDPIVEDWAGAAGGPGSWFTNPSLDQLGWQFTSDPAGLFRSATQATTLAGFGVPPGRGLYIFAPPKFDSTFRAGDYGQWWWKAPGETTFISRADFRTMFFDRRGATPNKPVVVTGLWSSARGAFSGVQSFETPLAGADESVVIGENAPGAQAAGTDIALFEMLMPLARQSPKWLTAYLGGAVLHLDDPEPATVSAFERAADERWVRDGVQDLRVEGTDPGLGVKRLELRTPGAEPEARANACLGNRLGPCPRVWEQSFQVQADDLPEGVNELTAYATDVLGKRSAPEALDVRVDRSAPAADVTGRLRELDGSVSPDGSYGLQVAAQDGTPDAPRSGVRSVEVLLNGERVAYEDQDCTTDSCPLSAAVELDAADLPDGDVEARVTVIDLAGNRRDITWEFHVQRSGGLSVDSLQLMPWLETQADDPPALPGSDVTRHATIQNVGSDLDLLGDLTAANDSESEARVVSHQLLLEYLPRGEAEWRVLAGDSEAMAGYEPQTPAPPAEYMYLTLQGVPADGVTYGERWWMGANFTGTVMQPGTTARWTYEALPWLVTERVQELLDSERVADVRFRAHLELGATSWDDDGQMHVSDVRAQDSSVSIGRGVRTQSGVAEHAAATFSPMSSEDPVRVDESTHEGLGRLDPGDAVATTADGRTMPIEPRGEAESEQDYVNRLEWSRFNESWYSVELQSTTSPPSSPSGLTPRVCPSDDCGPRTVSGWGSGRVGTKLPVLALDAHGPDFAMAGTTGTYTFKLRNSGTAPGVPDLTHVRPGGDRNPVPEAGEELPAGESRETNALADVPDDAGNEVDETGEVRWRDAAGNVYGPITKAFKVRVFGSDAALATIPAPPLDPTTATIPGEATRFIYEGDMKFQYGVVEDTIAPERAATVRVQTNRSNGDPLPGVEVTVAGSPQYGRTYTRLDGSGVIAVNGGGPITLEYKKPGYLPVQRQVDPDWQDVDAADPVALVKLDEHGETVEMGPFSPPQVVRGSVVSDHRGTRQPTLLLQEGTQVGGNFGNPLDHVTIRQTEYTQGPNGEQAMPGALAPNTAYTYAVELSVDEIPQGGVTFSKPVFSYTDNFLGFPTGSPAPVGSYDSHLHRWIPERNGRVIEIVGEADGLAQVDVTGSGEPASQAELDELGMAPTELAQLAEVYEPGKSLWRVPMTHFTPWDVNWPWTFPDDAQNPFLSVDPNGGVDTGCPESGSVIDCENQVLGERVPVPSAGFGLSYRSNRTPAGTERSRTLEATVSAGSVPASLKRIKVNVEVGGKVIKEELPAQPNQKFSYRWDGKDMFGRPVQGGERAKVSVGYVYDAKYAMPGDFSRSFTRFGGAPMSTDGQDIGKPPEVVVWEEEKSQLTQVDAFDARGPGVGGWTPDVHHSYDPNTHTLRLGNGQRRVAKDLRREVGTIAGTGEFCPLDDPNQCRLEPGEARHATQVPLTADWGIEVSARGEVFVENGWIFPDGNMKSFGDPCRFDGSTTLPPEANCFPDKGRGSLGYGGDMTRYPGPFAYSVMIGGKHLVDRRLLPEVICGSTNPRRPPPGQGQCTQSDIWRYDYTDEPELAFPFDIQVRGMATAPDDSLWVGDNGRHTPTPAVYQRTLDARWARMIGGKADCVEGDPTGVPATDICLTELTEVEAHPDGRILVSNGGQLLSFSPVDGRVEAVAGEYGEGNEQTPRGDGGPAKDAVLGHIDAVAAGRDGAIYVGARYRVWRIDQDGTIHVIAGTGEPAGAGGAGDEPGDGSPAAAVPIDPAGMAVGPDNTVYVRDGAHVRTLTEPLPGYTDEDITIASEDGNEVYDFDQSGRHLRTRDADTGHTIRSFEYDASGRLAAIDAGDGNVTRIERDDAGTPAAIVGPYGERTVLEVNADGYLEEIQPPGSQPFQVGYEDGGLLSSFTDPAGRTSHMEYGEDGELISDTGPGGRSTTLSSTRTPEGFEIASTTAEGRVTRRTVEHRKGNDTRTATGPGGERGESTSLRNGRLAKRQPDGTVVESSTIGHPRFGLDSPQPFELKTTTPSGLEQKAKVTRVDEVSNPEDLSSLRESRTTETVNGKAATHVFNRETGIRTSTTPAGRRVSTTVDASGRPVRIERPGVLPEMRYYDDRGRLAEIRRGDRQWVFTYDEKGRLATLRDPAERTTAYTYDAAGRTVSTTLPGDREIATPRDAGGDIASITPPGGSPWTFEASPFGGAGTRQAPGQPAAQYAYNRDGQLTKVTNPDGTTVDVGYDSAGRIDAITHDGVTTEYGFSEDGKLASLSRGGQRVDYEFDGMLQTGERWSGTAETTVRRTYDDDFRVRTASVGGETPIAFDYDDDGLPVRVGSLLIERDPISGQMRGGRVGETDTDVGYDDYGDVERVAATVGGSGRFEQTMTRDELGRVESRVETTSSGTSEYGYVYDDAGRLQDVVRGGETVAHYEYDPNGNRVAARVGGEDVTAQYDGRDRLTRYGANTYEYDGRDGLRSKTDTATGQVTTYTHDTGGNLERVELPDGRVVSYVVDGEERRIARSVDGQRTHTFVYGGGSTNPIAELDSDGSVRTRFVYGTRANVPDYMVRNGRTYRFVLDDHGSPRQVVDAETGEVAQELDYDEFGNVVRDTDPGFQPFGYAGGLYDHDTGLVHFGAREYDAETGRWTTPDPSGFNGGDTNLYAYVSGDPINNVDPTGMFLDKLRDGLDWAGDKIGDAADWLGDKIGDAAQWIKDNWGTIQTILTAIEAAVCVAGAVATGGTLAAVCLALATAQYGGQSIYNAYRELTDPCFQWLRAQLLSTIQYGLSILPGARTYMPGVDALMPKSVLARLLVGALFAGPGTAGNLVIPGS